MKKIIYLLMILLLLPLSLAIEQNITKEPAELVLSQSNPNLIVATLRYEPYPVQQGTYFDIWLKIQNTGEEKADDMSVSVLPSSSFSYSGQPINTGIVPPGQYVVVKIEDIKVNPETPSGSQELKVELNPGGSYKFGPKTVSLNIEVKHIQPVIEPLIYTVPDRISQGQISTLFINLESIVSSTARNIEVKVRPPDGFTVVGSTNEKRISWILPNRNKTVSFDLIANPTIESKPYKIPIEIYYYNDDGSLISTGSNYTYETGILVEAPVDYQLDLEESKIGTAGQVGDIIIAFSNIGASEIRYSSIELIPTNQYDVVSPPRTYIGNLEPDDFETVDFKIRARTSKTIDLKLKVIYKTSYNEEFEDTKYVKLPMYSKNQAITYGLFTPTSNLSASIFYLIVIILVYVLYKEWRRLRSFEAALKSTSKKALIFAYKLLKQLHPKNLITLPKRIKLKLKSFLKE